MLPLNPLSPPRNSNAPTNSVRTLATVLSLIVATGAAEAQIHRTTDSIRRADLAREAALDEQIMVPMRDGTRLATKVYRPKGVEGPLPTVFWRTPYNTSPLAGSNPNRPSALLKYALDSIRRGKAVFKTSKGRVGGCLVTDGRVNREARARVLRDGQAVYDGGVQTLKRFQDEVPEVRNGLECGIKLGDFNDYEEGDVIECYELERLPQTL